MRKGEGGGKKVKGKGEKGEGLRVGKEMCAVCELR